MAWVKGQSGNPAGRRKGSKNKIPSDLKELVLKVAEELQQDPKTALLERAKADPCWFYEKIMAKVLPKDLALSTPEPLQIIVEDLSK